MIKVLFVCVGNICRSASCEYIFKYLINKNNLNNKIYVESRGVNAEVGSDIYPPSKIELDKHNIPYKRHFAKQFTMNDYLEYDLIIAMEESNIDKIHSIINSNTSNKIYRLMDFTLNPKDVLDPWYYGNFDKCFDELYIGCSNLLNTIKDYM